MPSRNIRRTFIAVNTNARSSEHSGVEEEFRDLLRFMFAAMGFFHLAALE